MVTTTSKGRPSRRAPRATTRPKVVRRDDLTASQRKLIDALIRQRGVA